MVNIKFSVILLVGLSCCHGFFQYGKIGGIAKEIGKHRMLASRESSRLVMRGEYNRRNFVSILFSTSFAGLIAGPVLASPETAGTVLIVIKIIENAFRTGLPPT